MKLKIFIDGQNFYNSMLYGGLPSDTRVNYDKFADCMMNQVGAERFGGAYYYIGVPQELSEGIKKFLYGLEMRTGFFVIRETRTQRVMGCPECRKKIVYTSEKGVDTRLSVDMVHFAATHAMDVAILCSGDEDFIPAIEAVNSLGIETWVATWGNELSPELRRNCFGQIDLQKLAEEFTYKKSEKEKESGGP